MAMFGMTDEKKSLLIREIQRRPLIWKVTDAKYTDVPTRWLAFEEIAKELSDDKLTFTSDMIKVAWKNMMDYYNQIRRRHDRASAAGMAMSESKWQFYHMMQFTRQDKPPVKRKYNWMEPSKIPREPNESFVSEDYKFYPLPSPMDSNGKVVKPIPVWPVVTYRPNILDDFIASTLQTSVNIVQTPVLSSNQSTPSTGNQNTPSQSVGLEDTLIAPRTKMTEKARIQAKREALRDTNIMEKRERHPRKCTEKAFEVQRTPKKVAAKKGPKSCETPKPSAIAEAESAPTGRKRGRARKRADTSKRSSVTPKKAKPVFSAESSSSAPGTPSSIPDLVGSRLEMIKRRSVAEWVKACAHIGDVLVAAEGNVGIAVGSYTTSNVKSETVTGDSADKQT